MWNSLPRSGLGNFKRSESRGGYSSAIKMPAANPAETFTTRRKKCKLLWVKVRKSHSTTIPPNKRTQNDPSTLPGQIQCQGFTSVQLHEGVTLKHS